MTGMRMVRPPCRRRYPTSLPSGSALFLPEMTATRLGGQMMIRDLRRKISTSSATAAAAPTAKGTHHIIHLQLSVLPVLLREPPRHQPCG